MVQLLMQVIFQEEQDLLKDKMLMVLQEQEVLEVVGVELNTVIKAMVSVLLVLLVETVKYNTDS
jgi:hypothetical protein